MSIFSLAESKKLIFVSGILLLNLFQSGLLFSQETVRDEFGTISYSNNDGTKNWSTDWIESNDDDSPSGGYIQITGDELRFRRLLYNNEQIRRSVDLSGAASAAFSFRVDASDLPAGCRLYIQISKDGVNFSDLDYFEQNTNSNKTYDISGYISSSTTIRFINNRRNRGRNNYDWGDSDYVYVDDVQIAYTSDPCTPAVGSATIWSENFEGTNQGWSLSSPAAGTISSRTYPADGSGGTGIVGTNLRNDGVWTSDNLNISGYNDLKVTLDIGSWAVNDNLESPDYIQVYYSVDGAPEQMFEVNGEVSDDVGNQKACTNIPNGNNLMLRVVMHNTAASEYHYIDNIEITGISAGNQPVITDFSPANACEASNQEVTINGSNFTGITGVAFNGTNASVFSVVNDSQIKANLPSGAGSGAISVTNTDGTGTSTQNFTVNPLPAAAGNITGADIVLPGDTKTYVCASIADATSYEWSITGSGASITNSGTQADIVFAGDAIPGDRILTVKGVNACGTGPVSAAFTIYVRPSYACQTTIVNWDFDSPDLAGADWRGYTTVNGWQSSLNNIEIWRNGFMNIFSVDGGQFCELNSTGVNEMWQDVATIPGSRMRWAITYRYRDSSSESIRLQIGAVGSLTTIQDISNNNGDGWVTYSGFYTIPAGQTTTQFRILTLTPNSSSGNLIDKIQFYSIEPDIEQPTFDCPLDLDGDGYVASECTATSNFVVENIGLTNVADNCSPTDELLIEYSIVKEDGTTIVNYGDDPTGTATSQDASGYSFPLGVNTITYRVTDKAGNWDECSFKIAVLPIPNPKGIFHE